MLSAIEPIAIEFFRSGTGDYLKRSFVLMINSFWIDEEGQTLIEYGLLISLIALVVVAAVVTLGRQVGGMWGGNSSKYPDNSAT